MSDSRFALWKARSFRFAMGAGATFVTASVGILRNKWFAQHLDVSGIGVLAQIVATQGWLGMAGGMGLGLPVARHVGAAEASGDRTAARRVIGAALALLAVGASAVTLFGLLLAPAISRAILGTDAYAPLLRISMIGVAGIALQQTLSGLFAGRSDLKSPLALAIVGGSVSLATAFVLVPRIGITGAVLAVAVFSSVGCAGALFYRRREYAPFFSALPRPLLTAGLARSLLTVSGASLFAALLELGTLLTLRSHYVRANSVEANGFLQAGLAISQAVGSIFYAYISSYAFGKISGFRDAAGVRSYTRKLWTPIILAATAAFVLTRLGAAPLLRLLYSHRFDAAEPLMAWALAGELGRVALMTWALGSLPLGGARLWFPTTLAFPVTLSIAYASLVAAGAGPLSFPKAYAVAGLVSACVGGMILWRRGVTLMARDLLVFLGGAGTLLALAWITTR